MAVPEVVQKESEFEKLRVPIQEIIAFTNSLDEKYREKCFEVLLNFYMHKGVMATPAITEAINAVKADPTTGASSLPLAIRGFLNTYTVPTETIGKLFLIENGEAIPTYKIKEQRKGPAQVQLALLSAFKNALINPTTMFEFSIEDVRELCKEHNVYDGANFMTNFKNNIGLFKDFPGDEKHVKLTPDGKTELAKALIAVAAQ